MICVRIGIRKKWKIGLTLNYRVISIKSWFLVWRLSCFNSRIKIICRVINAQFGPVYLKIGVLFWSGVGIYGGAWCNWVVGGDISWIHCQGIIIRLIFAHFACSRGVSSHLSPELHKTFICISVHILSHGSCFCRKRLGFILENVFLNALVLGSYKLFILILIEVSFAWNILGRLSMGHCKADWCWLIPLFCMSRSICVEVIVRDCNSYFAFVIDSLNLVVKKSLKKLHGLFILHAQVELCNYSVEMFGNLRASLWICNHWVILLDNIDVLLANVEGVRIPWVLAFC